MAIGPKRLWQTLLGTHEDERTVLFKTISLYGVKPNTNPIQLFYAFFEHRPMIFNLASVVAIVFIKWVYLRRRKRKWRRYVYGTSNAHALKTQTWKLDSLVLVLPFTDHAVMQWLSIGYKLSLWDASICFLVINVDDNRWINLTTLAVCKLTFTSMEYFAYATNPQCSTLGFPAIVLQLLSCHVIV